LVTSGATGINFTGSGVSVTNTGSLATVSITGGGSSSTIGVYSMKLEFSGGNLIASPFLAASDPNGNNLIGATGWTFTRDGNGSLTVTHPQGKWFVNFNRYAQQSAGGTEWVSANFSGSNFAVASVKNYTNQASFSLQALTNAQTGIAGSGIAYMFITWQEPAIDFYS